MDEGPLILPRKYVDHCTQSRGSGHAAARHGLLRSGLKRFMLKDPDRISSIRLISILNGFILLIDVIVVFVDEYLKEAIILPHRFSKHLVHRNWDVQSERG